MTVPPSSADDRTRCASCGGPNACRIAAAGGDTAAGAGCWCRATEAESSALQRVPDELRDRVCLCRACLTTATPPLPDGVRWVLDPGGRPTVELRHGDRVARVATTGAQVLSFTVGDRDVLWTAGAPEYAPGRPVRGGIPVVFPWFGDHRDDPSQPAHGFARSQHWRCTDLGPGSDVTLTLEDDERTRARWPHAFRVDLRVALDEALTVALRVENRDRKPFRFEQALHTYFAVGNVHEASVHGLEGVPFVEHAKRPEASWDPNLPLHFRAETDRVFQSTPDRVQLVAPAMQRTVTLATRNAHSAIVWNPWPEKTARLSQMLPDDWRTFCCIESANVHDGALELAPGAVHELELRLSVADGA